MWNAPYPASSMRTRAVLEILDRIEAAEGAPCRHWTEHHINIFGGSHRLALWLLLEEPKDQVEDTRLAEAYKAVLDRANVVWNRVVEGHPIEDPDQFKRDALEAYSLACEGSDLRWGSPLGEY